MKKKKIIISICLVLVMLMSAFVTVQATSGDENNIFEQLKALITGNTNRIEKLEKDVDDLENEVDKLKGEITELQKPKEEEKETQTENKDTNNNKPTTNTTTKKATSNSTAKKASTTTTANSQNKIDTLNKEIASVKKDIEKLEKQDNKQTKDIENLKNELNNKSEELKNLINSNNNNSSSNVFTKKDLIGTWKMTGDNSIYTSNNWTITFNDNNTATMISNGTEYDNNDGSYSADGKTYTYTKIKNKMKYVSNYTYTLEGNYINLTLVSATKQIIGGTKTVVTRNYDEGGKETRETVEIKAQKPVNDPKATKKTILNGSVINNTLYINSLSARCVKSK